MNVEFWVGIGIGVIALLVLVIWSIRRHLDPELTIECDATIDKLMPTLSGLTLSSPVKGNRWRLLENGEFFDVLVERISAAKETVHFETFLWKEGEAGRRVSQALAGRARAGVRVRVLLDATGSRRIGLEEMHVMRAAGCTVKFFHKRSLRNLGVLNDRDHRKLCIVDGREAFVGGHCIVDDWLGNAEDGKHFSDVSLLLHGPIVHSLQGAFSENWAGETGEIFVGEEVFPALEAEGDAEMHAVFAKPENSAPTVKILHHTVICLARKRVWIQNPYFIPKPDAIEAMGAAVKRGVDVRVLMPSTSGSDNPIVQHAGHRNFEKLLRCGVKLYEYPHTLLHQKVMTVDGVWSAVGSSNFDDRSFETNDEVTVAILDPELARTLDGIWEKYAARSTPIELEKWRSRSPLHKLQDNVFYLIKWML